MTIHEIEIRENIGLRRAACSGCDWAAPFSVAEAASEIDWDDVETMLVEYGERVHLMDDEHDAVRIAGAFLTRRRHSFVGRLDDGRVIIVASTGDGYWVPVWNTENAASCPITEPRARVSLAIHAVCRTTGHAFK